MPNSKHHQSAFSLSQLLGLVPNVEQPVKLSAETIAQRVVRYRLAPLKDVEGLLDRLTSNGRLPGGAEFGAALVNQGILTSYQWAAVSAGQERSLKLGKYIVLDKLGQGGAGTVFKARQGGLERAVALKVLSQEKNRSRDALQRFKREMMVGARLDHPNIVAVYDADEADGVPFLVMQYVDETDLSTLVRQRGPLPETAAVGYVLQAARGLERAHAQGIVHRDIKPSNLLLDRWGTVKVVDFGLARIAGTGERSQAAAGLTSTGTIMGTADYMPPEQALNTRDADHRADIYSLGAVLYFLLTGRSLYAGETVLQKIVAHRDWPIPSLPQVRPDVTPDLQAVFERMVAKQPEDRMQAMSAVVAALERCPEAGGHQGHQPVAPPLPPASMPPGKEEAVNAFLRELGSTAGGESTASIHDGGAASLDVVVDPFADLIPAQAEGWLPSAARKVSLARRSASYGLTRGLVSALRAWCF